MKLGKLLQYFELHDCIILYYIFMYCMSWYIYIQLYNKLFFFIIIIHTEFNYIKEKSFE